MEHRVQVWRGLFKPEETIHTLRESKSIHGYRWRLLILLLCSSIIFGITFYIQSAEWLLLPEAVKLDLTNDQKFAASILIGIGGGLSGIILPFLMIGSSALLLWGFFRDIGFKRLFVMNTYLFVIILIGLAANLPFMYAFGSTEMLSPYGIGPWVKALTDHVFLTTMSGWITIFFIWHMYSTIRLLMEASLKSKRYILCVTIGLHIILITCLSVINMMYHLHLNG
ncbi:hypothetical protein [Pseudalkalibacillus berkeleyi]|uniref:Yip1 domain-containing protein n=1 Tax=Pseudalkalibacillus berkeleyi TaxID=1069813 RepID=A0ABS9GVB9_9BACL|nr:hypothetical protein [Pseudalkalibacillus berkeleyi]MCF6136774.1 hypothetical protein [Pseudalkalibacillus berkeleyi]